MHVSRGAIIAIGLILLIGTSGCLDRFYEKPATPQPTAAPTAIVTPESFTATVSPSDMALLQTDLPPDYFIRDRTVTSYDEQPKINRDLGWRQGYMVSFYRMNLRADDLTGITQTIGIYPLESMNKLYSVEKDALLAGEPPVEKFEIPFPVIGEKSIAVRRTNPDDPYNVVTYTVLFVNRNVLEKITMTGSTTDYEAFKDVAKKAAARVR